MTQPIHIIAEAGTNHNADPTTARALVDAAAAAGADSVKFQLIYPEGLYLPRIWADGAYTDNEVFEIRRKGMLSDDDWRAVTDYCRQKGVPASWSAFDVRGLDFLVEMDVPYIKIASCDLNNGPLLREAAQRGKKLVVSTGMATLGEVEQAVAHITAEGHDDLVLMHCVSVYPCPTERTNLGFIDTLRTAFGFPVGLSDHTEASLAAAVGVAKGVSFIEKHYTLDRTSKGFDHAYAMEPDMLAAYIADVRACEAAVAPPERKVGETESGVKTRARRGLHAARTLEPGQTLTEQDVLIVRPEAPLAPNDLPLVVGGTVTRRVEQYEALSLSAVASAT